MTYYIVSMLRDNNQPSTYWSYVEAPTPLDAAKQYANASDRENTGAQLLQRDGGIVVVGEQLEPPKLTVKGYGISVFRFEPVTPEPTRHVPL